MTLQDVSPTGFYVFWVASFYIASHMFAAGRPVWQALLMSYGLYNLILLVCWIFQ